MLRDRQRQFAAAVFDGQREVATQLRPGRFPAEQLLQVYRNNVVENLTGALRAVFPVVEKLVGTGFFRYAAHEYLHAHRPRAGNLHEFGDRFPEFLAAFLPAAALPYLPDVARLEWAWHEAYHAADAPAFDAARLAAVPPEHHPRLRFALHPSARLLSSDFPVIRIFAVNQDGYAGDPGVDLAEGGARVLVIRRGLDVCVEPLAHGEFTLLRALADGRPLVVATEAALALDPEFDLAGALSGHVRRGTLVDWMLDGLAKEDA